MNELLRPLLVGTAIGAVLVVALALFGVELPFAIAWGILVIAAFAITRPDLGEVIPAWPPKRDRPRSRGSEVSRLAWSFNSRTGLAGPLLVRRVRALVSGRLARRGLDLDDDTRSDEIDALLGRGVREALSRDALGVDELARVLDAVEGLAVPGAHAPAPNMQTAEEQ